MNENRKTINYIIMEGIIRTIFKLEGFSVTDAFQKAITTLNNNHFYSLVEKKKILK